MILPAIFSIPGQQPSNLNLFDANFAEQFMFGAQDDYLTKSLCRKNRESSRNDEFVFE